MYIAIVFIFRDAPLWATLVTQRVNANNWVIKKWSVELDKLNLTMAVAV